MIEWKEEKSIQAPIEDVWILFSDENVKRIMPKVEKHTLIEGQEHEVGAKHEQTYREGKRLEKYIVETLAYEDQNERKHKKIAFTLAKAFQITLTFTLVKVNESETRLIYEGQNKGVNFIGRAMLKLGNKKGSVNVAREFIERVEREAMLSKES